MPRCDAALAPDANRESASQADKWEDLPPQGWDAPAQSGEEPRALWECSCSCSPPMPSA